MPSFDVVSKVDIQEVSNAVNNTLKEIGNRYDFKSVKWSLELDRKEKKVEINADGDYYLEQIISSLKASFVKRQLDVKSMEFATVEKASGNTLRQKITIKEGIDQDNAKKITKHFKASKMKVQASIQGDEVRVSGKSRDDLQQSIQEIKGLDIPLALQFINFRD